MSALLKAFFIIFFVTLLVKNPFSGTNYISNLGPFPDSIHYLNSAQTLAKFQQFKLYRIGNFINPDVPPLYPFFLAPLNFIFDDIRSFYFLNCLLAISSFVVFLLLLDKIKLKAPIIFLGLLAYSTTFILFWYPTVAMAENLLLLLFLASIYLILDKLTIKNLVFSSLIIVLFFATKYIATTLSFSFFILFLIKIIISKPKNIWLYLSSFIIITAFFAIILSFFEYQNIGYIPGLMHLQNPDFNLITNVEDKKYISFDNFQSNFIQYLGGLMGGNITLAGASFQLIAPIIGMASLVAIFFNLILKENRLVNIYLFSSISFTVLLGSLFFTTDGRYIIALVPALILSFLIFCNSLFGFLIKINKRYLGYLLVIICAVLVLYNNFYPFRLTFDQNFFNPHPPSNYTAVKFADQILKDKPGKKYLISIMPPYYHDFFQEGEYSLLPLAPNQFFMEQPEKVWGLGNYDNLTKLYSQKISQGDDLYLLDYLTDVIYFKLAFQEIQKNFNLQKISTGCGGKCSLYIISK